MDESTNNNNQNNNDASDRKVKLLQVKKDVLKRSTVVMEEI